MLPRPKVTPSLITKPVRKYDDFRSSVNRWAISHIVALYSSMLHDVLFVFRLRHWTYVGRILRCRVVRRGGVGDEKVGYTSCSVATELTAHNGWDYGCNCYHCCDHSDISCLSPSLRYLPWQLVCVLNMAVFNLMIITMDVYYSSTMRSTDTVLLSATHCVVGLLGTRLISNMPTNHWQFVYSCRKWLVFIWLLGPHSRHFLGKSLEDFLS